MGVFKDIMTDLMDHEDEVELITGVMPEDLPDYFDTKEITDLWRAIQKIEVKRF